MKRNNILCLFLILLVLTVAFCGCQPVLETSLPQSAQSPETAPLPSEESPSLPPAPTLEPSVSPTPTAQVDTSQNQTPAPSETPLVPSASEPIESTPQNLTCFLSVRCDNALQSEQLSSQKRALLPADGNLLTIENAVFYEGETVFHLLSRELKKHNIHFEYSKNPAFKSIYIEGISNLYEFDCADHSGWIYKVNGKTASVGCSQTILKPGDKIEFLYSCELSINTNESFNLSE